jgi:Uncharacterised protein conserved in bacteria (DUF2336)
LVFIDAFSGTEPIFTSEEIWQRRRIAFNAGFTSVPLAESSLFDDFDEVLRDGSPDKRVDMLRRITRIEAKALAEISSRLAPAENAPRLARREAIAVAEPVLMRSTRLTTHDLAEIARTSGQDHLLAISGRRLKGDFAKPTKANTQRLLRFWQVRHVATKSTSWRVA